MAKRSKRGPYRCAACREYGHRADKCPNKHKLQTILDSLPGEIALQTLVPEYFQIVAVIEGSTGEALRGAIDGVQRMVARGLPPNNSVINAYHELATRAAKVSPKVVAQARDAYLTLLEAERKFNHVCQPIHAALGHENAQPISRYGSVTFREQQPKSKGK